jgi:Zn-finger nucleic acid-binding protein
MQCPACGNTLTQMTVADVAVDVCAGGCGGIWFDNQEVHKLDDTEEAAGETLLGIERDPGVTVDHDAQWGCPRCGHPAMTRHFYSPQRSVELDECPKCGGVWLDAGELATIRAQYAGGAERRAAHRAFAEQLYAEQLGEPPKDSVPPPAGEVDPAGPAEMLRRLFDFL